MEFTPPTFDVNIDPNGFVVDIDSLYAALAQIADQRHARGVRYAVVTVLVFLILAKLAGEDRLSGIADWVHYRIQALAEVFHLKKPRAPCANTYRNILTDGIELADFERVMYDFFARQPQAGESLVLNLDGKTLRGTIPAGQTRGQHLLAAYLPAEGWVLCQVEVERHENEIVAAPKILKSVDLRGKIVTGDAMLAQRELSLQIVSAEGDYVWTVKGNQSDLNKDIALLFQPEATVKGFSAGTKDFRTAETLEKNHGRLERRTLTVSAELKGYLDWPGAEQVFKLERHFVRLLDQHVTHEIVYGITSLNATEANPEKLLHLIRSHWGIENGLHYRRDETLREDWCHLKRGPASHAMASLNNLIVGLILRLGWTNLAEARRFFDAHPDKAQQLVLHRLSDF